MTVTCNLFFKIIDPAVNEYLMVLEYANQGTLRKYLLDQFSVMTWSLKLKFAKELTSGIKCLHEEGIIHRDLVSMLIYYIHYSYSNIYINIFSFFFSTR